MNSIQLNLFDEGITLDKVIEFVNRKASWMSQNCYKTVIHVKNDFVIVFNRYFIGEESDCPDEEAICHDSVTLSFKDRKYKILEVKDITVEKELLNDYPFLFDSKYYEDYLIGDITSYGN